MNKKRDAETIRVDAGQSSMCEFYCVQELGQKLVPDVLLREALHAPNGALLVRHQGGLVQFDSETEVDMSFVPERAVQKMTRGDRIHSLEGVVEITAVGQCCTRDDSGELMLVSVLFVREFDPSGDN